MPRTTEVADNVIAVVETASTNTLARQMLRDGTMAPPADGGAGVVVVATDVQSAGRGRLERTWVSAPGESMTCSYIATLPAGVIADGSVNGWLTVIAGFAALDALRGALAECGVASEDCGLRLKWPNDLFCQASASTSRYRPTGCPRSSPRHCNCMCRGCPMPGHCVI